jgi:hypothetical protein
METVPILASDDESQNRVLALEGPVSPQRMSRAMFERSLTLGMF